jgi:hypothetical protein
MTNVDSDAIHPSRRRLLQALSLVAAQSTPACRKSDSEAGLSIEVLRDVSTAHGSRLTDERLEAIRPTVEQQLGRLAAVRRFDLDERVEPATIFLAKR